MKQRVYKLDNFRAFLMLCVIAGHLCSTIGFPHQGILYRFIYTFHMPAFVFLSGICANGEAKKAAKNYLYPYAVFQVLYFLFRLLVLQEDAMLLLSRPDWLLWYLLSLAWWNLLLPLFQTDNTKKRALTLVLGVCAALAAGFFRDVGYTFSLSRTIVFFPFFLTGYYLKERLLCPRKEQKRNWKKLLFAAGAIVVVLIFAYATLRTGSGLKTVWYFGTVCYYDGYTVWIRLALMFAATLLTASFWILMPHGRIPVVSAIGKNTMPSYLLHGFAVLALRKWKLPVRGWQGFWAMLVLTVAMAVLFSLPIVVRLTKPLMRWPFDREKAAACNLQERS